MKGNSYYASAERSDNKQINLENALVVSQKLFSEIFGALNGIGAVLNKNRQIVYANNDFLSLLGLESLEPVLGKRPGEVVSCLNANKEPFGCGTSEACSVCGAVSAILESQAKNKKVVRETRITSSTEGQIKNWDLIVTSAPIDFSDEKFYIFTIEDISDRKRKEIIERIFFHDILNIAGGLNGLLTVLKAGTDPKEAKEIINTSEKLSMDLIEEIIHHRQLRAAEDGDLKVNIEKMNSLDFLNSSVEKIKYYDVAKSRAIIVDNDSASLEFESDRILLQRIMINLLKNALEATLEGGVVNAGCRSERDKLSFRVKNAAVMPKEVQLQVFQRSFSTKGKGRGVGTYSIKLLTENYLNGKVSFVSNEAEGTVFTLTL